MNPSPDLGLVRKTKGQWQQEGGYVHFNLDSDTYRARFDTGLQRLVVRGMGEMNEVADVAFPRE